MSEEPSPYADDPRLMPTLLTGFVNGLPGRRIHPAALAGPDSHSGCGLWLREDTVQQRSIELLQERPGDPLLCRVCWENDAATEYRRQVKRVRRAQRKAARS